MLKTNGKQLYCDVKFLQNPLHESIVAFNSIMW